MDQAENSQADMFLYQLLVVLVIYLLLGVALSVVAVVALPLLLPQPKPPPEADKSPGPPKLAIKSYLLGSYLLGTCSHSYKLG